MGTTARTLARGGAVVLCAVAAAVTGCGAGGGGEVSTDAGVWVGVDTGGSVTSVAAVREGFVAAQDVSGACEVLVSEDGVTWEGLDTGAVAGGERVSWMAGGSFGAAGEVLGGERPEVVVTTDGVTFTRTDPLGDLGIADVGIIGMAWGPAGVAVVLSRGGEPMGLALSEDGRSWSRGALPGDLVDLGDPGASPIAATDSEYLVRGFPDSEDNPGAQAWSSPDAASWQPEEISTRYVGAIGSPVGWRSGFVVWGEDSDDPGPVDAVFTHRAWSSAGDGTWVELEVSGVDIIGGPIPVAGSSAGVLAVSWRALYQELDVLFSPDLVTWRRWTQQEAFGTPSPDEVLWGSAAMGPTAVVVPISGGLRVARL